MSCACKTCGKSVQKKPKVVAEGSVIAVDSSLAFVSLPCRLQATRPISERQKVRIWDDGQYSSFCGGYNVLQKRI